MRFTDVQVALFHAGIRFVHLSPDRARSDQAESDFRAAVEKAFGKEPERGAATFIVCCRCGRGVDHVPVLFVEDPNDCDDEQVLQEAYMIPAPDGQGCGPMVIR